MPLHVSRTNVLIIRRSKLYYTASGIITHCRWPSDAEVERCDAKQAMQVHQYKNTKIKLYKE